MNKKVLWIIAALTVCAGLVHSTDMDGGPEAKKIIVKARQIKGSDPEIGPFRRGKISVPNAPIAHLPIYIVIRSEKDRPDVKKQIDDLLAAFGPHRPKQSELRLIKILTVSEMNREQHSKDTNYWEGILNGQRAAIASYGDEASANAAGSLYMIKIYTAAPSMTQVVVKNDQDEKTFEHLFQGLLPESEPGLPIYTLDELRHPEHTKRPKPQFNTSPKGIADFVNYLENHLAVIMLQIWNGKESHN
jgi:hypothetical protein